MAIRKKCCVIFVLWCVGVVAGGGAHAANGEAVYRATCNTCHDSGAGLAPRVTHRDEWMSRWQRGRAAMYEAAINGVPNSAMAAKGGYVKLSDSDVRAAVDYILARTGYQDSLVVKSEPAAVPVAAMRAPQTSNAPVADPVLLRQLAEALRQEFSPGAQIESVDGKLLVRGVNIRVGVRDGVVTLEGTPEKPEVVGKAEQIAKSFRSVQRVDNRMVAAGMLDFD
jgi:cytochrome c5